MVVAAKMRWVGDTDYVKRMKKRRRAAAIARNVDKPWIHWMLTVSKLDQFRRQGEVRGKGGQRRWRRLKRATIKAKGHSYPLQGRYRMRFGTMARSYEIHLNRSGTRTKTFALTNRKTVGQYNLAEIHDRGTRDGRIPARRNLRIYGRETREYLSRYADWVMKGKRRSRGKGRRL